MAPPGVTREEIAAGLRPLLELPVEHVLATHGGPFDRADLDAGRAVTPTGADGTPEDFTILAVGDTRPSGWGFGNGAATMGAFTSRGGTVFTASTTDWARVLAAGDPVDVMMFDGTGTVLARYPSSEKWVGQRFQEHPTLHQMLSRTDGNYVGDDIDGVRRIFGFAQLPGVHARLAVGSRRRRCWPALIGRSGSHSANWASSRL